MPQSRSKLVARMQQRMLQMESARDAIVKACGGPWKRGDRSQMGACDCPVCGVPGYLNFTRSGVNGHIHAQCRTLGCIAWME